MLQSWVPSDESWTEVTLREESYIWFTDLLYCNHNTFPSLFKVFHMKHGLYIASLQFLLSFDLGRIK